MTQKHDTERVSRLLSWEADVPLRPRPPLPQQETRIEFPSWLEESDLTQALARVDDRGGTALPQGLVDRRPADSPPPRPPARVAPPRGRPQPPKRLAPPTPPAKPTATRPTVQILVRKNGAIVARRSFSQTKITIGRGKNCTLRLDDVTVSRHHAQIVQRGAAFVLEDVQSCNGVKVNGHLTERQRLKDKDVIALGEHELHVIFGRVPVDAPEPPPALLPESGDNDSDDADAVDPCLQTIFGRTSRWKKRDVFDADNAERSINARAYLRLDPQAQRFWPNSCQIVLERDVFLIGSGEEVDLRVQALWVPRVAGVIVRGPSGFSLAPVSYWRAAVRLNGQAIWRAERLEPNDVITIAGQSLTFLLGMPV